LKAFVSDARSFRNLLAAVSPLIEEAGLNMTPEGFKLRSMDPSHIAMVEFEWNKPAFKEYECLTPMRIRFYISDVVKKLRGVAQEPLDLSYDEKTRKFVMVVKGKWTTTFTLPTLDPGDGEIPAPKIEFNTKIKMTSPSLAAIIDQAQNLADNVRLESSPDRIIAEAVTEISGCKMELEKGSDVLLELNVKEPCKSTYNLNYLGQITKAAAPVSELVTVEFSTNMPVKLEYEMPEGQGRLVYYVAPRIEAD
jgi:proliferating cell nuclear antigen